MVLVVDDTPALVALYVQWLDSKYDVRSASDGVQALRLYDETVDTVLLDRQMPGLSGEEVATRLRDREGDPRIVFVSSLEPNLDAMDVRPDAYLVKPVTKAELLDIVEPSE